MNKTIKFITAAVLSALALNSCNKELIDSATTTASTEEKKTESRYLDNLANICVSEAMAAQIEENGIPAEYQAAGVTALERVFPDAGEWEERHRRAGLHKWYTATIDNSLLETKSSLEFQSELPEVEQFERCPRIKQMVDEIKNFPFNDPYGRIYQWNILNDGTQFSGYVSGADVNVAPVYESITGGSPEVIVAIVDGGIDPDHPDMSGVVLPAESGGSRNFVTNTYSFDPSDHGCHVGSIVGAINNNGRGGCGVAGGLDGTGGVRLMSCVGFGSNDKQGNFADAIVYAADNGALICNNSWGYSYDTETDAKAAQEAGLSGSVKEAIDYFTEYAGCDVNGNQTGLMKGGLVLFAAGNNAWPYGLPAAYEGCLAVGAIGPDGRRATYSNYGDWVDLCAPGGEMDRFSSGEVSYGYSWIMGASADSGYVLMCGTSQACPMVAGVAALIVSEKGGDGYTVQDLQDALLKSATYDVVPESDMVGPLVNAYAAITYDNNAPVVLDDADEYVAGATVAEGELAEVVTAPGVTFTLDASRIFSDPDGDAMSYTASCDNNKACDFDISGDQINITAGKRGASGTVTLLATDVHERGTSYEFKFGSFDDSEGPAIYPNPIPVLTGYAYFNVCVGSKKDVGIKLYNSTGGLIMETEASASVFEPAYVRISDLAPGKYVVHTTYGGKTYNTNIVKL